MLKNVAEDSPTPPSPILVRVSDATPGRFDGAEADADRPANWLLAMILYCKAQGPELDCDEPEAFWEMVEEVEKLHRSLDRHLQAGSDLQAPVIAEWAKFVGDTVEMIVGDGEVRRKAYSAMTDRSVSKVVQSVIASHLPDDLNSRFSGP